MYIKVFSKKKISKKLIEILSSITNNTNNDTNDNNSMQENSNVKEVSSTSKPAAEWKSMVHFQDQKQFLYLQVRLK